MFDQLRVHRRGILVVLGVCSIAITAAVVAAAVLDLTMRDFFIPGTQIGTISPTTIIASTNCAACHGHFDQANEPYALWRGSLMGNAGRDPLFFAQMTLANQDVSNAGYYCMRCHVPASIVSGHAMPPDGSALTSADAEGVSCHFCHSMVDPIYRPGVSPVEDEAILTGLGASKPEHYGNSMFVLDPLGRRRGARPNPQTPHEFLVSPFHATGDMCGTCHEVGNVAVSRQPDGTYRYNAIDQPSPTDNPDDHFPLERTYSEWKLSAFASGGVNMGGRFGGTGATVVSTCQDCHMPRAAAQLCLLTPARPDARRHEFAGASAQVLDLIAAAYQGDPSVDQQALAAGRAAAVSMLHRAASLGVTNSGPALNVRVTNESGHKLPTGHIEGRRVWINVKFLSPGGQVIQEHGAYDLASAELDAASTTVYEMHVGLSQAAATATGLSPGPTSRMALADTIVKDNRIPPRGFSNGAYLAKGAPVVGTTYADGQYWDDESFAIPGGTATAVVSLYYQNTPREYIEHLRDANVTNAWGTTLYALWQATGRGQPIQMATGSLALNLSHPADFDHSGRVAVADIFAFLSAWFAGSPGADFDGSGALAVADIFAFLNAWFADVP
jgi:hypothetical protein